MPIPAIPRTAARAFLRTVTVLLCIDGLIIGLYVGLVWLVLHTGLPDVPRFLRITGDATLGEIFNYLKWLALVLLLWTRKRRAGDPVAGAFAAVFAIVLADDMLRIHERAGDEFDELLGLTPAFGLAPDDFGELIAWAILGIFVVWFIWRGMQRGTAAQRRLGLALCAALAALIGVGIGADMLEQIIIRTTETGVWLRVFLHVLEDGGEMVFGSVAVALAVAALPPLSPRARS